MLNMLSPPQPAGPLLGKCVTLDQGRALVTFLDAASEKTLRSTVALTAARGRGKVQTRAAVMCRVNTALGRSSEYPPTTLHQYHATNNTHQYQSITTVGSTGSVHCRRSGPWLQQRLCHGPLPRKPHHAL